MNTKMTTGHYSGWAAASLWLLMLTVNPFITRAQNNEKTDKPRKYELAIDLVPLIDNGQFGKIYFKINRFKDKTLKGAYRFGASAGNINMIKSVPYNGSNPSWNIHYNYEFSVITGYEKYKMLRSKSVYYGIDLLMFINKTRFDTYTQGNNFSNTKFGLCPFVGLQQPIYKNFSASFELGGQGWFGFSRTFEASGDHISFWSVSSNFSLPYNFTLSYEL